MGGCETHGLRRVDAPGHGEGARGEPRLVRGEKGARGEVGTQWARSGQPVVAEGDPANREMSL